MKISIERKISITNTLMHGAGFMCAAFANGTIAAVGKQQFKTTAKLAVLTVITYNLTMALDAVEDKLKLDASPSVQDTHDKLKDELRSHGTIA